MLNRLLIYQKVLFLLMVVKKNVFIKLCDCGDTKSIRLSDMSIIEFDDRFGIAITYPCAELVLEPYD